MKKHIRFIITACLALCMVLCMGLAVACQNNPNSDNSNTFTITLLDEAGKPVANHMLQYCSDGPQAQCTPKRTDSKGKVTVDVSTDEWKNSKTIHILIYNIEEGYKVYDKAGSALDYNEEDECYEVYVDHHKVNNATFTIKAASQVDPNPDAEDIQTGYQYDVRGLSEDTPKYYATIVDSTEAYFEADVHGGEFELSVTSGTTSTVVETLNADNTSVNLSLVSSDYGGTSLSFTITPKNANSNRITFNVCPVYEIGSDGKVINAAYEPDVFKVYFVLDGTATLTFENPWGDPISEDQVSGFPITLKIGSSIVETWDTVADIAPIPVPDSGYVSCTFEFGVPDEANLYLLVKNANATSDNDSIVLGEEINVTVENMFDESFVRTFVPEESGTYLITITGGSAAKVSVDDGSSAETYFAESDGVIKVKLVASTKYTFIFGTDNFDSGDSYTAVVTKSDEVEEPDNPEDADIKLGESFTVTLAGIMDSKQLKFYAEEAGTYLVTVDSETAGVSWLDAKPTGDGKYVFEVEVDEANKLFTLWFTTVSEGETYTVTVTKKA